MKFHTTSAFVIGPAGPAVTLHLGSGLMIEGGESLMDLKVMMMMEG